MRLREIKRLLKVLVSKRRESETAFWYNRLAQVRRDVLVKRGKADIPVGSMPERAGRRRKRIKHGQTNRENTESNID